MKTALEAAQLCLRDFAAAAAIASDPSPASFPGHAWTPVYETFGERDLIVAKEAVSQFVADLAANRKPYWLTLTGRSGNGKTFLARQVWRWFLRAGRIPRAVRGDRIVGASGAFRVWRNLAQACFDLDYSWLRDLSEEWLVIVDDIAAVRDPSGNLTEQLWRLMDSRLGQWTFFTSNKHLAHFAALDVRISSRLQRDGNRMVSIQSADYALRKKP